MYAMRREFIVVNGERTTGLYVSGSDLFIKETAAVSA